VVTTGISRPDFLMTSNAGARTGLVDGTASFHRSLVPTRS